MHREWVIRSKRVVLPDGVRPASIKVRNGIIDGIGSFQCSHSEDAGDWVIMPGLVDTHVHINEPGRTEWEGFSTATRAAAAGGITTVIEMPLNSIPATTSVAAFQEKASAAQGKCWIDVGFWGGVVPGNLAQLKPLLRAGCFGFKCFLTPSGVDEFPCIDKADLRLALIELGSLGALLLVHAELPEFISSFTSDARKYSNYLNSRPKIAENSAIQLLLHLSAETGCAVHIVHLSSAEALEFLRAARSRHLPVTVETCPHYLAFRAEEIPDGATEFKCAPPIREANNREKLWQGLRDGDIDMIVTDHSPCPPQMKQKSAGDFFAAWGGIASLQLSLPVIWTEAKSRGFKEEDIARWMAAAPARLAGLSNQKGKIAPGYDADLVVWDPAEEFTVEPEDLCHRHKLIPYANRRLCGVVKETYLRGQPISSARQPLGRILRHSYREIHSI
ncbi:MAG TPA: allantoinase AllB [Candidatus Angelobacter sp.]|nr:allantoinase AllB [Candidatus Angelobacter sp.]